VIVIAGGVPGIFIRHYDVGELSDAADRVQSATPRAPSPGPRPPGFHALTDLIAAIDKPVIAAINGLCMGGGFELSLACDLRIAGSTVAAIGLPETRLGIFPGGGGTQRLPRIIGEARALEMILRGLTVTGAVAHEMGIVHELAQPGMRFKALAVRQVNHVRRNIVDCGVAVILGYRRNGPMFMAGTNVRPSEARHRLYLGRLCRRLINCYRFLIGGAQVERNLLHGRAEFLVHRHRAVVDCGEAFAERGGPVIERRALTRGGCRIGEHVQPDRWRIGPNRRFQACDTDARVGKAGADRRA